MVRAIVDRVVRRYGMHAIQIVPALMLAALLLFMVLGPLSESRRQVGVGGVVVAVLVAAGIVLVPVWVLTTHVTLTPAEISYRGNFRSGTIPWTSVESVRVGRQSGRSALWCVVVEVRFLGSVQLPVAGPKRYVHGKVTEFEAYRAWLSAQPPTTTRRT
jgi:hypothetical protein